MRGPILLLTASVATPMHPFRKALLRDRSIALSGDVPDRVVDVLRTLGAQVSKVDPALANDEQAMSAWADANRQLDSLVCGEGSGQPLDEGPLDSIWSVVRAVTAATFIPDGQGRIMLVASKKGRRVAGAGLENLARTLSVEWARFGITTVAVVPGASTSDDQLAQLVAFLCSPAGAYYSGCRVDVGLVERQNRT